MLGADEASWDELQAVFRRCSAGVWRSSYVMRSVTWRCSHCWNCQYTVCEGGKSTGNCRQEQPERTTNKIASTIAGGDVRDPSR